MVHPKAFASHYFTVSCFIFEKHLSPTTTVRGAGIWRWRRRSGVVQLHFLGVLFVYQGRREYVNHFLTAWDLEKDWKSPIMSTREHMNEQLSGNRLILSTVSCTSNYSGYTCSYLCIYICLCKCIYSHLQFICKEQNIHRNYFKPI